MRSFFPPLALATTLLLFCAGTAIAQISVIGNSNARECYNEALRDGADTRACDKSLSSELLVGRNLAATYVNRAVVRTNGGNMDAALEDLERAERELDGVRSEAEEAKSNLVRFREEIRDLVNEKGRMLATLASATARRRMAEAIDGLSVDADMRALDGVREHIARIATESSLDREIGADQVRTRIRSIRDEVRDEAARRELAELKAQLDAPSLPRAAAPEPAAVAAAQAASA